MAMGLSDTFSKMKCVDLEQTDLKAYAYSLNTPMKLKRKFTALIETKQCYTVATFYVTKNDGGYLLSYATAKELGLMSLHINTANHKGSSVHYHRLTAILDKFPSVFSRLGKLKD